LIGFFQAGRNRQATTAIISDEISVQGQEAIMSQWHDSMVDRPNDEDSAYMTGWTISGLAVLGAIVTVWMFGI
jgi:hypothetical protein